jgi:hypothetical protein
MAASAYAQITFQSGTVYTQAQGGTGGFKQTVNPIHSFPGVTASNTIDSGGDTSTTTAELSTSTFDITLTQELTSGGYNSFTLGGAGIYFVADGDTFYSLTGNTNFGDDPAIEAQLNLTLENATTGQRVFYYNVGGYYGSGIFATTAYSPAAETGGSWSGNLINGDLYELEISDDIGYTYSNTGEGSGAALTGALDLTFVPEPSPVALLSLGFGVWCLLRRRRAASPSGGVGR